MYNERNVKHDITSMQAGGMSYRAISSAYGKPITYGDIYRIAAYGVFPKRRDKRRVLGLKAPPRLAISKEDMESAALSIIRNLPPEKVRHLTQLLEEGGYENVTTTGTNTTNPTLPRLPDACADKGDADTDENTIDPNGDPLGDAHRHALTRPVSDFEYVAYDTAAKRNAHAARRAFYRYVLGSPVSDAHYPAHDSDGSFGDAYLDRTYGKTQEGDPDPGPATSDGAGG